MPASRAATLIGATQMFGMAGGSAGQFVVGPIDRVGASPGTGSGWSWASSAFRSPSCCSSSSRSDRSRQRGGRTSGLGPALQAMGTVFINPQSILCGLIAGLIFIPTTIFDMVWGVRFLQEAHDVPYSRRGAALGRGAVRLDHRLSAARLAHRPHRPPQAGDHRRRLVLLGCAGADPLRTARTCFPPYSLGLVAGIASGAAMIPYTVIKEANRPEHSGTATGVINFLNFSLTALLGPIFAELADAQRARAASASSRITRRPSSRCSTASRWRSCLTLLLRETGPKAAQAVEAAPLSAGLPAE